MNWYNTAGSPTDPADNSDPKFDYLSPMTFDSYLTQTKKFRPVVSDFYTRYAVDALDGTTSQVSAYTWRRVLSLVCLSRRELRHAAACRKVANSWSDQRNDGCRAARESL